MVYGICNNGHAKLDDIHYEMRVCGECAIHVAARIPEAFKQIQEVFNESVTCNGLIQGSCTFQNNELRFHDLAIGGATLKENRTFCITHGVKSLDLQIKIQSFFDFTQNPSSVVIKGGADGIAKIIYNAAEQAWKRDGGCPGTNPVYQN
jgi:hypothetical protein